VAFVQQDLVALVVRGTTYLSLDALAFTTFYYLSTLFSSCVSAGYVKLEIESLNTTLVLPAPVRRN
jgi:hypothetical protein